MQNDFYTETVERWKKLYPPIPERKVYDPTKTRATCIRCGSSKKVSRHHIANDFWFATLRPDLYAARYVQFKSEDVAKLCDNCHKLVHENYKKMMIQVKRDYPYQPFAILWPPKEWCDKWMQEFRDWFAKWIQKPYTKRKRKRKRK